MLTQKKKLIGIISSVVVVTIFILLFGILEINLNKEERQNAYVCAEMDVSQHNLFAFNIPSAVDTTLAETSAIAINVDDLGFHDAVINYGDAVEVDKCWFVDSIPKYLEIKILTEDVDFMVGEYFIDFQVLSRSVNYYIEGPDTITCKLIVLPAELESTNFSFDGGEFEFTGEEILVEVAGVDEDIVVVEYKRYMIIHDAKIPVDTIRDVGEYLIEAKLSSKVSEYSLDLTLTAEVRVVKKTIDLTTYIEKISYVGVVYDGQDHNVNLFEEYLPSGVVIEELIGINQIEVFNSAIRKEFKIYLTTQEENFVCDQIVECVFEILPKPITISLVRDRFEYSASIQTLEWCAEGLISGDTLNISYTGLGKEVGEYSVEIIDIGNSNYVITNNVFSVEIFKADVDISQDDFANTSCIYNGSIQKPSFVGSLPNGIVATIENKACIQAGIYYLRCIFSGSNTNYELPKDYIVNLTILPKPIRVIFTLPEDMLESGEEKTISVEFNNLVAGDDVSYSGEYSGDTRVAGIYSYAIKINNANYVLSNSNKIDFVVYAKELQFKDEDLQVRIDGMFEPISNLIITNLTSDPTEVHTIDARELNGFKMYNFDFQNLKAGKSKVTVRISDLCNNSNYLKVFAKNDFGKWSELDYEIVGNSVVFYIDSDITLLFAEYKTPMERNLTWILLLIVLFIITSILTLVFITIDVKNKKKKSP